MNRELEFLKKQLTKNETIVVACSGGPDSMCLYTLANNLKEELNLKIVVAHVNHKIRKESDEEAKIVETIVKNDKNIFELLTINDYLNDKFTESDARKRRYEFFDIIMKRYSATTLLTAHHGDDLIETILMRITRGSNLNGYSGIKQISKNDKYQIVRPLLTVSKEDILVYLTKNNIGYVTDKSNEDLKYTRNRYRHHVIEFLHKENKDIHNKYLKFSEELQEYDNFVNSYIDKNNFIVDNYLDINKVKSESMFIIRKCIEKIIKNIQENDIFDISSSQMNELLKLFKNNNKTIDLNNGYKGINSYGKLTISKSNNEIIPEIILDHDIMLGKYYFYYNSRKCDNTNSSIFLDASEIALPIKIRAWQNGDKMIVKNLNGSKKISDIFKNSKIPKQDRKSYPVVVDSNNTILWLPNIKKSQFAKDKLEKYDIIIKCEAR